MHHRMAASIGTQVHGPAPSNRGEDAAELKVAAGGQPANGRVPHYFVLGESAWFRGLYTDPGEVRIPLADLPSEVVSFTYPDSMASMELGAEFGLKVFPHLYHNRVYRLHELEEIVETYGLPRGDPPQTYDGHQRQEFEHYIEVQI